MTVRTGAEHSTDGVKRSLSNYKIKVTFSLWKWRMRLAKLLIRVACRVARVAPAEFGDG